MATLKRSDISELDMLVCAADFAEEVKAAGIPVIRVKVEELVPRKLSVEEQEEEPLSDPQYWETHLKMSVQNVEQETLLREFKPDVALSHNLSKFPDPTRLPKEVLVTMRMRGVNKLDFLRTVDEMCRLLQAVELPAPVNVARERVVFDNNVGLDAGWCE